MNKIKKENRRAERLSWFSETPQNEILEKNGFIYFKHWDGNKLRWTVSEFTKDSWARMKNTSYREIRKRENQSEMQQASLELENKYLID